MSDDDGPTLDWRDLDPAALGAAGRAFIEEAGTPSRRVAMAVTAYLWSMANRTRFGPDRWMYPSLDDWRAERARLESSTPLR